MRTEMTKKGRFELFARAQLANYYGIILVYRSVIETVKRFDNKVINKRFLVALKNDLLAYSENNNFDKIEMDFKQVYFTIRNYTTLNDSIIITNNNRDVYKKNEKGEKTLFLGYISDYVYSFDILYVDSTKKRLDAKRTVEMIKDECGLLMRKIVDLNDCIDNYDTYLKRAEEIQKAINDYKESVPALLQIGINTYSNNYIS